MSVTTLEDSNKDLPDEAPIVNISSLSSLHVTHTDVLDQIKSLDVNKSYGPDGVSPRLLKEAGDSIAKILQNLFNKSLSHGIFPNLWKQANVMPIFKKGCKETISNYRRVTLLSTVGKMFEKSVFKYI